MNQSYHKATLEFDLSDQDGRLEFEQACAAREYSSALGDLAQWIQRYYDTSDTADVESLSGEFWEILSTYGIDPGTEDYRLRTEWVTRPPAWWRRMLYRIGSWFMGRAR